MTKTRKTKAQTRIKLGEITRHKGSTASADVNVWGSRARAIAVNNDPFIKKSGLKIPEILPQPQGWRLLIVPYVAPEKIGSIILTDSSREIEQDVIMCGLVLDMGLDAYKGTTSSGAPRFVEPWCQIGDWVMFAKWAGSRIQIKDIRYRLLNDDEVFAVVDNPESIVRA